MSTAMPSVQSVTDEVRAWWEPLSDQERIIAVLEWMEELGILSVNGDPPSRMAEKPWKWAAEAYAIQPQAECFVCIHLREEHNAYLEEGCGREDCDCRDFEPFPVEKAGLSPTTGKATP